MKGLLFHYIGQMGQIGRRWPPPGRIGLLLLVAFLLGGGLVSAQSGGAYDLSFATFESGGQSSGDSYELTGLIGQFDATTSSWGGYTVEGGFLHPTGASSNQTNCATVTEIPQAECEALLTLYNSTGGPGWSNNTGWTQTNTPCSWFGVTCAGGHVTEISLWYNGLTGTIPTEISNLTSLTNLYLTGNQLTNIPAEISNLTGLTNLSLSSNQLTNIPAEIGNLTSLTNLSLNDNQLTDIPAEIGNLTNLTSLSLGDNQLTAIPPEIGNLTSLPYLDLNGNQLTDIPAEIGNLTNLTNLSLGDNQLTDIPTEISNLTNLTNLSLGGNQLTDIPPILTTLTTLTGLDLSRNRLTGPIPPEVGQLTNLTYLDLFDNQLSGPLPAELGSLQLGGLYIDTNFISGALPASLLNLNLSAFHYDCTDVDVPTGPEFEAWLDNVGFIYRMEQLDPNHDCVKLLKLYHDTGGFTWTSDGDLEGEIGIGDQWRIAHDNLNGTGNAHCGWKGITCDQEERVIGIELPNNNLSGTLPETLGDLERLATLKVNGNSNLEGSLPLSLTNLTTLDSFHFDQTGLCEPDEESFQNWLNGINDLQRTGVLCSEVSGSGSVYLPLIVK